jgi:hypothetical protein
VQPHDVCQQAHITASQEYVTSVHLLQNSNTPLGYFQVNHDLLFSCVTRDNIRTLSNPPPFPQQGRHPPFTLPPTVQLVMLRPPTHESKHMLVSETYDKDLFRRVNDYFTRFYVPQDPSTKVTLAGVEVVFNAALEEQFAKADVDFNKRFHGAEEFRASQGLQQFYLSHLAASKNMVPNYNSNPISAWHGVSSQHLDSICWYGLLNLSSRDPGNVLNLLQLFC